MCNQYFVYYKMNMENDNLDSTDANYNFIKTDAQALLGLVNKYVKVQMIKDTEFLGFVHSIDPIQYSIILIMPQQDSYTVNIIPGHAILDVVESHPAPNFNFAEHKMATQSTPIDIIMKKQKLISWFKKNLLPVTESGQKILFGNISILPPYGVNNICTGTPVVAMQLRKIIENMPDDFDPENN